MKRFLSIALALLFVVSLTLALGLSASAEIPGVSLSPSEVVNTVKEIPVIVLVLLGIVACLVGVWLVVSCLAAFVFPFRVIFGFKVKTKKKNKKKKKTKKAKEEDETKKNLTLTPEETKKVLIVGGCVIAGALLLGAMMKSRRR